MASKIIVKCVFCKKEIKTNNQSGILQSHPNQFNAPCVGSFSQGEIIDKKFPVK